MAHTRRKSKGRKDGGPSFLMLHHHMLQHPNYAKLSARAVKMLVDIGSQYNGKNNGDLAATRSIMLPKGWTSNDQRQKAIQELLDSGFLVRTRPGSRLKDPALYAITWLKIDECNGKHDLKATSNPSNDWKKNGFSDARTAGQTDPPRGPIASEKVIRLTRRAGRI